jgi:hypothetical protein
MTKEAPWQPANAPSLLAETVGNVLYQNPKKINFKSKFLRFFCSLQLISPDYSQMLENHRHTLFRAFGTSPFRPRSMGLYLVGHSPIRSKGAYSCRRRLNESLTFRGARPPWARPSAHKREKPGRYESRRIDTLRCQRGGTWQVNHCDLALKTFRVRLPAGQ